MANIIVQVCENCDDIYTKKAEAAKEWVENLKNEKIQTKRILNLIDRVSEREERYEN